MMKSPIIAAVVFLLACQSSTQALAEEGIPVTQVFDTQQVIDLSTLLERTQSLHLKEQAIYESREATFLQDKNQQQALVDVAKGEFLAQQQLANPLLAATQQQQQTLKKLQQELNGHSEELGDIHSIYRQFSGDFIARMKDSLVHAQFPQRDTQLSALQQKQQLASMQDMRDMWLLLMQEMTEAGKNTQFEAAVIDPQGKSQQQTVIRLGTFTAFSNGQFLRYIPQNQELLAISQQPSEQSVMADFNDAQSEGVPLHASIIDPSRGDLLAFLGQTPSLYERMLQGREVGFVIILLGVLGLLIILYRLIYLTYTWHHTKQQLNNLGHIKSNNPLGRVYLQVQKLDRASQQDEESLQLTLDEAILKELPKLEHGHSLIKLFSAIAPLLGLLGTVIGMIATFQSISLFGSGDAKLMAGGISQALVTTVLGLVVAIPLLLSHNMLVSFSKVLLQILDEQSAGILARDREQDKLLLTKGRD